MLVVKLLNRINVMRVAGSVVRMGIGYVAGGFPGLAIGTVPDALDAGKKLLEKLKDADPEKFSDFLREADPGQQVRQSIREFREGFEELLQETKVRKLVVVIDDLDRCTPDSIIETLEAIKLFLFVPGTAFIIGADERLVKYAVRRRFPELPGERVEVGRDYLEKLVQFPIRIPSMGPAETESYIKLLLLEECKLDDDQYKKICAVAVGPSIPVSTRLDNSLVSETLGKSPSAEISEALVLGQQISPMLAAGLLGIPRQCKRFLNTLMVRLGMARARGITLERKILAKLMVLEYMRPEAFKELAKLQAMQVGTPVELVQIEHRLRNNQHQATTEEDPKSPADKAMARRNAPQGSKPISRESSVSSTQKSVVLDGWLADPTVVQWIHAEPALEGVDLAPYLYFAREKLDTIGGSTLRMSPEAQEVLSKLLGPVDAERTVVLNRAERLSPVDAAAVLEGLGERARSDESRTFKNSPLYCMTEWVTRRQELLSEFATFLRSLPDASVSFGVVPKLAQLANASPANGALLRPILESWSKGSNVQLRTSALRYLEKPSS